MQRSPAPLTLAAFIFAAMVATGPLHCDCPMTAEAAVRQHDGFTLEATVTDREFVTVTVTNTGDQEILLLLQDWALRIGYESSAAIPTSVPAKRAHKEVLDPVAVAPGEAHEERLTMRSHRTRMAIIDLVPTDAPCDQVIWVRLTYTVDVGGEPVQGAANIQVSYPPS